MNHLPLRPLTSIGEKTLKRSRRRNSSVATGSIMMEGVLWTVCFLLLVFPSEAQVGSNICACTPSTYEFTFDFSQSCEDTQLPGPGIVEFECIVTPFVTGNNVDLVPASVETVDFVEFDQALGRLAESSIEQQFRNGDTVSYTSYSATPEDVSMPTVPKGLQLNLLAQNAIGQPLLMTFLITFSNSCNAYPVISTGNQIGWVRFSAVAEPDSSLCPAVLPPTPAPVGQTMAPVQTPPTPRPPSSTPRPTSPATRPPFPCRPAGGKGATPSPPTPPSKGYPSKGYSDGKGGNVFRGPYYYYPGKSSMKSSKSSMSKKSKKHHSSSMSKKKGKSSSSSGSSTYKKKGNYYYSDNYYSSKGGGYYVYKGKGKGGFFDRVDNDGPADDDDLPICPTPSPPAKGSSRPKSRPQLSGSRKSDDPPSGHAAEDDDQVHLKFPPPTPAPVRSGSRPTSPTAPSPQQSQENPAGSPTTPARPPASGPVVADWGEDNNNDNGRVVRAALFAGAGVLAALVGVIATVIYRREKQYVAKEVALQRTARTPLRPTPRRAVPVAHTMSNTEASQSELTSLARP